MSTFVELDVACPRCGVATERRLAKSLNMMRSPECREAILSGTFQRFACPSCRQVHVAEAPFIYIDFDRRHWLATFPGAWEADWRRWEDEPAAAHRRNLGDEAPPLVQELGEGMRIRSVFSHPALREKLLCFEHDLDDAWLEAFKLALMRRGASGPFDPDCRPRLARVTDDALHFDAWEAWDGGWRGAALIVPRDDFTRFQRRSDGYDALLDKLSAGPYVDLGRLF